MKQLQRILSGALFGGALMVAANAVAPQPLSAQFGLFCDEAGGKVYCCSTDSAGKIIECKAVAVA